jgi:branched-chain amino acid transport system ATP-binding protein
VIVEQNARKILAMTDRAVILARGRVVHEATSAALACDSAALEQHLGVSVGPRQRAEPHPS